MTDVDYHLTHREMIACIPKCAEGLLVVITANVRPGVHVHHDSEVFTYASHNYINTIARGGAEYSHKIHDWLGEGVISSWPEAAAYRTLYSDSAYKVMMFVRVNYVYDHRDRSPPMMRGPSGRIYCRTKDHYSIAGTPRILDVTVVDEVAWRHRLDIDKRQVVEQVVIGRLKMLGKDMHMIDEYVDCVFGKIAALNVAGERLVWSEPVRMPDFSYDHVHPAAVFDAKPTPGVEIPLMDYIYQPFPQAARTTGAASGYPHSSLPGADNKQRGGIGPGAGAPTEPGGPGGPPVAPRCFPRIPQQESQIVDRFRPHEPLAMAPEVPARETKGLDQCIAETLRAWEGQECEAVHKSGGGLGVSPEHYAPQSRIFNEIRPLRGIRREEPQAHEMVRERIKPRTAARKDERTIENGRVGFHRGRRYETGQTHNRSIFGIEQFDPPEELSFAPRGAQRIFGGAEEDNGPPQLWPRLFDPHWG
jgi:hypothetical protein